MKTEQVTILPDVHPIWRAIGTFIPSVGQKIEKYRENRSQYNYTFNSIENDDFTRGLEKAQQDTIAEIKHSPVMQELLKKSWWSMNDRTRWEENLGKIASKNMGDIFGRYRSEGISEAKRTASLNDLSSDIKNKEEHTEFDCEAMSIIKGMIMQKADRDLLPSQSSLNEDYKVLGTYYYVVQPAHAFIVSPSTMSVIEGEDSSYHRNVNPWVDFQAFVEGEPIVVRSPKDQNGEYKAYGQLEGLAKFIEETDILRSLEGAEILSQRIAAHFVSPRDGESRPDDQDLKSTLHWAEEAWLALFGRVSGNPPMESLAKESFERYFLNKFKRSEIPLEDDDGGTTTLGESVTKWANGVVTPERNKARRGHGSSTHAPTLKSSQRVQFQHEHNSVAHLLNRSESSATRGQHVAAPRSSAGTWAAWNAAEADLGSVEPAAEPALENHARERMQKLRTR